MLYNISKSLHGCEVCKHSHRLYRSIGFRFRIRKMSCMAHFFMISENKIILKKNRRFMKGKFTSTISSLAGKCVRIVMLVAVLMAANAGRAAELTIAEGSDTNNRVPVAGHYDYSMSFFIYPAGTAPWPAWTRASPSTSSSSAAIPPSAWAMRACMSASST